MVVYNILWVVGGGGGGAILWQCKTSSGCVGGEG